MSGRNIAMIIIILGALAVAGVLVAKQLQGNKRTDTLEQLHHYVCRDCKQDFTISLADYGDLQAAGDGAQPAVPCTHCGSIATSKGMPCWSCGRTLVTGAHGAMPTKCPHCGSGMTDSPNIGTP